MNDIVRREKPAYVDWNFVREIVKARDREIADGLKQLQKRAVKEDIHINHFLEPFIRELEAGE